MGPAGTVQMGGNQNERVMLQKRDIPAKRSGGTCCLNYRQTIAGWKAELSRVDDADQ
jgi:hypothetical protein